MFEEIKKRDKRVVAFDASKITGAIAKAGKATGEFDERDARKLTLRVLTLAHELRLGPVPQVEEIQDIVERVLLDTPYYKTAKSYILYREQHAQIRNIAEKAGEGLVEQYIKKLDWKIRENSNMCYSLQGLNNYISSDVTSEYWLNRIYPPEIRDAHKSGDLHLHDLSLLSVYCVGWDLKDLLVQGFRGVEGKVESAPPKHLRSALGQVVNFFYTLQGEAAGAQAISNFDTMLAPFIRHDGLDYREVKQAIQEFVFNINIPTRVGFQCVSEDTEILTPDGWKGHEDIEVGDVIKTFNIQTGAIEDQPVKQVFARPYEGPMHLLKNGIQEQLISPGHRVVRKKFNTDNHFVLEEIEKVAAYKSPVIVPVSGKNVNPPKPISDDHIELLAWIIAEGSKENYTSHRHCHRIAIYQSQEKSPDNYGAIISLLDRQSLTYSERDSSPALGGSTKMIRLNAADSQRVLDDLFGTRETIKFIPDILKNMDRRQARLFMATYLKADGHEGCKITTTVPEILDGLQQVAVDAEYGFTVGTRKPTIGNKLLYILRLIDHQDTYIQEIETVQYKGVIWCPTTDNETVIARRKGKAFITGNTPFTNVTMDLYVPSILKDTPVIIGGRETDAIYGDFQPEMDMLNRAFAEIMMEGDARGRVFTFPIPTYNITKDFDWDNPNLEPVWRMTGKYGIPYFSNYLNSDMSPEDARSMCPLHPDTKVPVRAGRGINIRTIKDLYYTSLTKGTRYEVLFNGKWLKAGLVADKTEGCLEFTLGNGQRVAMDVRHEQPVKKGKGENMQILRAGEIAVGMYVPFNATPAPDEFDNYDAGFADRDEREGRYSDNPVHTRSSYGDFYFHEDGYWWFPVKQIRPMTEYNGMVFCFTVDSEERLFQLANGLITHNCRLRLDNRELLKRGGGLFGANPLTGSIGVVTINLPRIGYLADTEKDFFDRLKHQLELARKSLSIKRKVLENFTDKNLYPYSKFYLRDIKAGSGLYWKNHFSTFGIIGMNEACLNFLGEDIASQPGQAFSLRVMDVIRDEIARMQEESGDIFNLEATPAEGTSYRLALKDKQRFPDIVCANELDFQNGEDPYYTNSTQLPVNYTDDIFETLSLQDALQTKYTGGTVLHIFLGEQVTDIETVKSLIKKVAGGYRLPYFTLTPTFSVCPSHGYIIGKQEICPKCGAETEVYSRVVGYLRPVKQWNDGKQAEFAKRKTFQVA